MTHSTAGRVVQERGERGKLKVCKKCGVNHDNPGDEQKAIQVLACALGGEFDFVTKDGPVAQPHREAGIA